MRTILFFFIAGTVIIFILVLFILFQFLAFKKGPPPPPTPTVPTSVPLQQPTASSQFSNPPVLYNTQKTDQLVKSAKNRQGLSQEGAQTKTKLTASLQNGSGSLYSSSNVSIEYVLAPDLFQAEIKNTNVALAKQEAINWMLSQGFTQSDLCKLPFSFYLNSAVSSKLKDSGTVFNPLPEGC